MTKGAARWLVKENLSDISSKHSIDSELESHSELKWA